MAYQPKSKLSFRFSCGFVLYLPSGSAPPPSRIEEMEIEAENQHHLLCEPGCEGT